MALLGLAAAFFAAPQKASAHEASARGFVLDVAPGNGTAIVRLDAPFGRPSVVTTVRVIPQSLARTLRAGQSILGTVDSDTKPWTLSYVHVLGMQAVTGVSRERAPEPSVLRDVHHIMAGEYVPAPRMLDQRGTPFSLRDYRGQNVVLAFAYTRCKDARECPLISAKFAVLQEKLRGEPVHLVEVTLDPAFDRPAVLAAFARRFGADRSRWTLATGDPEAVLNFAAQFDVTAFADERIGLIHPERTVLIDQNGKIRNLIDEVAWSPDEIVQEVRYERRLGSNPFERLNLWLSSAAVAVCGNAVSNFSGFTDLMVVLAIAAVFGYLLWRLARGIARGAA